MNLGDMLRPVGVKGEGVRGVAKCYTEHQVLRKSGNDQWGGKYCSCNFVKHFIAEYLGGHITYTLLWC